MKELAVGVSIRRRMVVFIVNIARISSQIGNFCFQRCVVGCFSRSFLQVRHGVLTNKAVAFRYHSAVVRSVTAKRLVPAMMDT